MSDNETPPPVYPHQVKDVVTRDDLAAHYSKYPEAYHEQLRPHVERHLADSAIDFWGAEETPKIEGADDIWLYLQENPHEKISHEQALTLVEGGLVQAVINMADRLENTNPTGLIESIASNSGKNFDLIADFYKKVEFDINSAGIVDELVMDGHVDIAVHLVKTHAITGYNSDKLLDSAITSLPLEEFMEAFELVCMTEGPDLALKKVISKGSMNLVLEVLSDLPFNYDSDMVLFSFVNKGKAHQLLASMDVGGVRLPNVNFKALADAVIYEGHHDQLLDNVDLIGVENIDFGKFIEQLPPKSNESLAVICDQYLSQVLSQADQALFVEKLLKYNEIPVFFENISMFTDPNIDYEKIMWNVTVNYQHIAVEYVDFALKHIDHMTLTRMYMAGDGYSGRQVLYDNMDKFVEGVNPQELMSYLVEKGDVGLVIQLDKLHPGLQIDKSMLTEKFTNLRSFSQHKAYEEENFANFIDMAKIVANALENNKYGSSLNRIVGSACFHKDLDVDYEAIVRSYIHNDMESALAHYITMGRFPDSILTMPEVAQMAMRRNNIYFLAHCYNANPEAFDSEEVFKKFLETKDSWALGKVRETLFKSLEPVDVLRIAGDQPLIALWMLRSYGDDLPLDYESLLRTILNGGESTTEGLNVSYVEYYEVLDAVKGKISDKEILAMACSTGSFDRVTQTLSIFNLNVHDNEEDQSNEKEYIYNMLFETQNYEAIVYELDVLGELGDKIDFATIVENAMKTKNGRRRLVERMEQIPHTLLDHHDFAMQLLADDDNIFELVYGIKNFTLPHDDYKAIFNRSLEIGDTFSIAALRENIPDGIIDDAYLRDRCLEKQYYKVLLQLVDRLPAGTIDMHDLTRRMINSDSKWDAIALAEYFDVVPPESLNEEEVRIIMNYCLADGYQSNEMRRIGEKLHYYPGISKQEFVDLCLSKNLANGIPSAWDGGYKINLEPLGLDDSTVIDSNIGGLYRLYLKSIGNMPPEKRPRIGGEVYEACGVNGYAEYGAAVRDLYAGNLPPDLHMLGVDKVGAEGTSQLRQTIKSLRSQLKEAEYSDDLLKKLSGSPLLRKELVMLTRIDISQWGSHDDETLLKHIGAERQHREEGSLTKLRDEYRPSPVIEVAHRGTSEVITEDVINRYKILRSEVHDALRASSNQRFLSNIVGELRNEVYRLTDRMSRSVERDDVPQKHKEFVRRRHEELRRMVDAGPRGENDYALRSLRLAEQNFQSLSRHDELHPVMRKLAFSWTLRGEKEWKDRIRDLKEEPTIQDISTLHAFVETRVNKQTFSKFFSNKKNANVFRKIVNTRAFETALARNQGIGIAKQGTKLQFVPTKGMLMELSGHIGDACWADKYDSIGKEMPNMTAVIMKQDPGSENEKLVGAALLIETFNPKTEEPILLLRGVNPTESFINKVSAESFYKQLRSYVTRIADERGRTPAIVIDDHVTGSSTNRPALYNLLEPLRRQLRKVEVDYKSTYFNNYDVTGDSYAL